jgi:hypothetical protein
MAEKDYKLDVIAMPNPGGLNFMTEAEFIVEGMSDEMQDDATDAISGAWKAHFNRYRHYHVDADNLGNAEFEIVSEAITDESKLLSE